MINKMCILGFMLLPESNYEVIDDEQHIYASANKAIIGSDIGLSPGQHQAIAWTNAAYCQLDH